MPLSISSPSSLRLAAMLAIALSAADARADVPPSLPPRVTRVPPSLELTLHGLDVAPDFAVFTLLPRHGVPGREPTMFETGRPLTLEYGASLPSIYLAKKAALEEWRTAHAARDPRAPPGSAEKAVAELIRSRAVVVCYLRAADGVSLPSSLREQGGPSQLRLAYTLAEASAGSCILRAVGAPYAVVAARSSDEPAPSSTAGCGGCALSSGSELGSSALPVLCVLLARLFRRARGGRTQRGKA